jgi:hypothetical protein
MCCGLNHGISAGKGQEKDEVIQSMGGHAA